MLGFRINRRLELAILLAFTLPALAVAISACGNSAGDSRIADYFSDPSSAQLALAVARGELDKIDALVRAGASVNAMDKDGLRMLDWALNYGQRSAFRKLLTLGADPNQAGPNSGSTSLHWAALNSDPAWLRMLLEAGGDPNLANARDETPLFDAISSRSTTTLDVLIDAGADMNHRNALGQTPAMSAAITFQYDLVLHFLHRGACVIVRDQFGDDLRDIVTKRVPADPGRAAARLKVLEYLDQNSAASC